MQGMVTRFYDLLASVYLYNEFTGYVQLEKLLEAVKAKYPGETEFIAAVGKHADDERKHYLMFRSYFQHSGRMPFVIDRTYGYIDLFISRVFKQSLENLDREKILNDDRRFFQLCRLIMMTEFRGMKQVDSLLRNRLIRRHETFRRVFKIIERDEPSHCFPYQYWLRRRGSHLPGFQESVTDLWIHFSIMYVKAPLLFLNWRLGRMTEFHA
jgi:hypothetical protein